MIESTTEIIYAEIVPHLLSTDIFPSPNNSHQKDSVIYAELQSIGVGTHTAVAPSNDLRADLGR